MKALVFLMMLVPFFAHSEENTHKEHAKIAAIADGVSTLVALSNGMVEMNPIIGNNPVNVIGITVLKYTIADRIEDKKALKIMTAVWGGAAVSNTLILLTNTNPVGFIGGILFGLVYYHEPSSTTK